MEKVAGMNPRELIERHFPQHAAKLVDGSELVRAPVEERRNVERLEAIVKLSAETIPSRFTSSRFHHFEPKTPSQQLALDQVEQWAEEGWKHGALLALIGPHGVGKSHLLYSAAWRLYGQAVNLPQQRLPFIRPWYRLADELRYGKGDDAAHRIREKLYASSCILIDEVRRTASTDLDSNELAKLACHCYDQRIPMLITTNVSPLEELMGAPAADRFTSLVVEGPTGRSA